MQSHNVFRISLITFALSLTSCSRTISSRPFPPAEPASQAFNANGQQLIGPGDEVSIRVMGQPELSGPYRVSPDGNIYLPLISSLQATGETPNNLKAMLTRSLSQFIKNPVVSASVSQFMSQKVYFVGEWNKPGPQAFDAPVTLLEAISSAGNLSKFASGRIVIIRKHKNNARERYATTLNDILNGQDNLDSTFLSRGDVVVAE